MLFRFPPEAPDINDPTFLSTDFETFAKLKIESKVVEEIPEMLMLTFLHHRLFLKCLKKPVRWMLLFVRPERDIMVLSTE
ncbi:hypothetical protein MMC2321_01141 [Chitinophaga sp. MM2321]